MAIANNNKHWIWKWHGKTAWLPVIWVIAVSRHRYFIKASRYFSTEPVLTTIAIYVSSDLIQKMYEWNSTEKSEISILERVLESISGNIIPPAEWNKIGQIMSGIAIFRNISLQVIESHLQRFVAV